MPNQMMIDLFRARAAGLVQEAKTLGGVNHPGLLGTARELLVRQAVAPLLPPDIHVLTGTIINVDNKQRQARNQDDIVLFDTMKAPLMWSGAGMALMPLEAVAAQIEVKSTLRNADMDDAVAASAELINLAPSGGEAPGALVFAFDCTLSGKHKTPLDWLLDAVRAGWRPAKGQATSPVQCLCVVGMGCWILTEYDGQTGWFLVEPVQHNEILAFASLVSNYAFLKKQNATGAGAYLLDVSWLRGPLVTCPLVQP
jgi:hypothetical protein